MMYILASLTIGFFFATCMLIEEPIFMLFPPPLVLPFIVGAVFAYFLGRRGWFERVSLRARAILVLVAIPSAIAFPVLVSTGESYLAMSRIELPSAENVVRRSVDIGIGAFITTVESAGSFDDLKAHFLESHGIDGWRDVPTLDPIDGPEALMQSHLPHDFNGYSFLLNRCGENSCATVGWHSESVLLYLVAFFGLLVLLCMIAMGPPKRTRRE